MLCAHARALLRMSHILIHSSMGHHYIGVCAHWKALEQDGKVSSMQVRTQCSTQGMSLAGLSWASLIGVGPFESVFEGLPSFLDLNALVYNPVACNQCIVALYKVCTPKTWDAWSLCTSVGAWESVPDLERFNLSKGEGVRG